MRQTSVFWPMRKTFRLSRFKTLENQPRLWTRAINLWIVLAFMVALLPFIYEADVYLYVRESTSSFRSTSKWLTDIGDSMWYLMPSGMMILFTGIISLKKFGLRKMISWYKWRVTACFIFLSIAGSGILVGVFKVLFGRYRPKMFDEFGVYAFEPFNFDAVAQSFPSGHATTCGALAMLLVLWFPRYKIIWIILGALFALTRVVVAKHYMSDIIIGYNLGLIFTLLLARFCTQRGILFNFQQTNLIPKLKPCYRLF